MSAAGYDTTGRERGARAGAGAGICFRCDFKMGSKEYWRTAMLGASLIPPHGNSNSATELLTVKHIMPQPWKSFF
jgi:hypothetical protein